jgi:hypothetical protein
MAWAKVADNGGLHTLPHSLPCSGGEGGRGGGRTRPADTLGARKGTSESFVKLSLTLAKRPVY